MSKIKKQIVFAVWFAVGIALSRGELWLWGIINDHHILNGAAMAIIPIVLFVILNYHKKDVPHYVVKSIICIYAGWMGGYAYMYRYDDQLGVLISAWIATMLTLLLAGMKIVQLIYSKLENRRIYFVQILLGGALALNVSYLIERYDIVLWGLYTPSGINLYYIYMIEICVFLALIILAVIYQGRKCYKEKIKNNNLTWKEYKRNAIKMTVIPFLLFIFPLRNIFYWF